MEKSCPWHQGYPPPRAIFYRAFIWKKLSLLTEPKLGPLGFAHVPYVSDLSLVGEAKISQSVYMEKNIGSPPRVTLSLKSPCPPSQLCDFSCKRFAAIYKEIYETFSRPGWLGMEVDPPTRDNFSPYKQARARMGKCSWQQHYLIFEIFSRIVPFRNLKEMT